jgi:hypothetical protein
MNINDWFAVIGERAHIMVNGVDALELCGKSEVVRSKLAELSNSPSQKYGQ